MHVAYPVRAGATNEELRYSIRTISNNLDVETLTLVGYCPPWLEPDLFIEGNRFHDKPRCVFDNVRLACDHPDVPDEFVWFNDDFYVLEPADTIPIVYRGDLADHIALLKSRGWWWLSLTATMSYLQEQGIQDPTSYDLHRPLPTVKADMAKALHDAADYQPANPPQWRTLYGNMAGIGGNPEPEDVKVYGKTSIPPAGTKWLSTTDKSWGESCCLREWLAWRFPSPSRWEK